MTQDDEDANRNALTEDILAVMRMDTTDDNMDQVRVFVDALLIYKERNSRHLGVWKDAGWRGCLFDVRKKTERLWNEFYLSPNPPEDFDSAYDAMNFLAFFVRSRNNGYEGVWRWNPQIPRPDSDPAV